MDCLSNGDYASMVDARLYLPQNWLSDPIRCQEAGIPEENRIFKTKIEIACDILLHQLELGTVFDFVSADGYYGNDINFGSMINRLGLIYMLDIHNDQPVYLEKPDLILPQRKSNRGREPKRLKATTQSIKVFEYYQGLIVNQWQKIKVRNTAKGTLTGLYHFAIVFVWNKEINRIEQRFLVIRKTRTRTGDEIKYSITNAEMVRYTCRLSDSLLNIALRKANRYWA